MSAIELLRGATTVARTFGIRGGTARALFLARRRFAALRAAPAPVPATVRVAGLPVSWPFQPDLDRLRAAVPRDEAISRARRVAAGAHHAYRAEWRVLPRDPADWHRDPITGRSYDAHAAWWRVPAFPPGQDIKDVWEPARFAWSYDLVRAWLLTRDDAWAEAFWIRLETFLAGTAPFRGVHWMCGQETAIRAIAWLWAETALIDAPSSTPARLAALREALAWSGERIADAIGYAISQRNNHAVSEAVGLIAIGARFRDADPRAGRWYRRGRRLLDRLVRDQFADDGWYIQHSMTYTRVALDQLVMAERLLASRGDRLGPRDRVRATVALLAELIDARSGDLPNHGPNDGALVLPLSTAPYRDFRPTLTAAAAVFAVPLPADVAPDAETLAWLGVGPPAQGAPRPVPRVRRGTSGWVHAVTRRARLFGRAPRYRSRPGHLDPLHVDLWLDGRPVAADAGTFRYHAPPPWDNALRAHEVHNGVTVIGRPVARTLGRFLWLGWPVSELCEAILGPDGRIRITMENRSWQAQGLVHRRTIELSDDTVRVLDDVRGRPTDRADVVLHWLLAEAPHRLHVSATVPIAATVTNAPDDDVRGWISDHYAVKRPAWSMRWQGSLVDGRAAFETIVHVDAPEEAALDEPAAVAHASGADR